MDDAVVLDVQGSDIYVLIHGERAEKDVECSILAMVSGLIILHQRERTWKYLAFLAIGLAMLAVGLFGWR